METKLGKGVIVGKNVQFGKDVVVWNYVVICDDVKIGDGTYLVSFADRNTSNICVHAIRGLGAKQASPTSRFVSGYGNQDVFLDTNTYTVTETSWTNKTSWNFHWGGMGLGATTFWATIKGYVSASGQTLHLRIRDDEGIIYWEGSITDTSETSVTAVFTAVRTTNDWWWDFYVDAYVGTDETGYITEVKVTCGVDIPVIRGFTDSHNIKPIRVDADGYLQAKCVPP